MYILEIPQLEMSSQCTKEGDLRKKLIEYYITITPWASWNHLAGKLLYWEQHRALEKVKGNVKVDKGTCVYLLGENNYNH